MGDEVSSMPFLAGRTIMNFDTVVSRRLRKTLYRDGDKCLKVFDESFSKSDVLNEALNQSRVEETGLNIPKVIEVTRVDGKWVIVSKYVEGVTLASQMHKYPEREDEYLELFVRLQLEVLSKNCPLLTRLKDKMNRKIRFADLDATTRYGLHARLENFPRHHCLCHGDFNPSNIVITPDNQHFIIDWSHATQGNASADAARTYLLFLLNGKKERAQKYLDLFCSMSKTTKPYVEEWMPIVAASQSVKGNPEEREFLLSWLKEADYR